MENGLGGPVWGRAPWLPPGSCPCPPGGTSTGLASGLQTWGAGPPWSGFSSTSLPSLEPLSAVEWGLCEGRMASGSWPQKSPGTRHLHPQLPAELQEPRDLGWESLAVVGSGAAHLRPQHRWPALRATYPHAPPDPGGRPCPHTSSPAPSAALPCRSCPSRWHAGSGSGPGSLQREQRGAR